VGRRRKRLLLSSEKILLHLEEFGRFEGDGEAPISLTQIGIADRVGLTRSHVPRALKSLVSEGLIQERLSHVRGGSRSRQTYFLTWEGSQAAEALRARIVNAWVDVTVGRNTRRAKVGEVPGLLGVRANVLDIAHGAEKGPVTVESLKRSVRREGLVECLDMAPSPRPFFGRQGELELLSSWLAGGARLITILGPSGIGKTSTALRLMRRLKGTYHLLWLPLEDWDTLPSLLRPLAAFLARIGRRKLLTCLEAPGPPETAAVHELLRTDFQDLAALIVIDDLQKASEEVARWVRIIAEAALGALSGPRLLILSRERRQLCAPRSWSGAGVHELVLQGLDMASAESLAGRRLPSTDRARILSAAGGHPLYIEILSRRGPAEGMGVVWEHIRNQLGDGLGKDDKRILSAASVYRRPVDAAALLSGPGALEALDRLVDRSLLVRTNAGEIGMHDMLREFFYSRLSSAQKAALHRRAAEHLLSKEASWDTGPASDSGLEILRHLVLSGEEARAASMAAQIGSSLVEAGLGVPLLREVLERLAPPDAGRGWSRILLLKAAVLSSSGERDRALREYRAVAAQAGPLSAEAHLGIGSILEEKSDWQGAARAYSDAARRSTAARPAALRGAARLAWRRGRWNEASAKFAGALRLARRSGDGRLAASILTDMGNLESDRGSPAKALELYGRAIGIMEKENALRELARVHNNIGAVLFYEDKWDDALGNYQRALELSERCGEVSTAAYALSNIGQILARRGDDKRALRYLDASTETFERLGDDYMLSSNLLARGILYRVLKDWERSEGFFRRGIEMLMRLDMPRELAEARMEHGVELREKGEIGQARKELGLALARFEALGAKKEMARAHRELENLKGG
jgi:tetratricopeptide (TPR) repeat protein/DNA-binding MarR family transcriptional regulator